MKDLTPITPEALIEMGFEESHPNVFKLRLIFMNLEYLVKTTIVWVGDCPSNATTIEDIKDLIRLFK
jgi:hypothetical protein